jgi:hypothetical protein
MPPGLALSPVICYYEITGERDSNERQMTMTTTTWTAETVADRIAFSVLGRQTSFAPLSAANQRTIFGAVVFGKRQVRWNPRMARVEMKRTAISTELIAKALNTGKEVDIKDGVAFITI